MDLKNIKLKPRQCITNAPEVYDYGWMRTLVDNLFVDSKGKVYRLAENEDDWHFDQQIMRYGSGMNATITNQISLDDHLRHGWLTLTDNPVVIHRSIFHCEEALDWEQTKLDKLIEEIDAIRLIKGLKLETHKGGLQYNLEYRGEEAAFKEIVGRLEACR